MTVGIVTISFNQGRFLEEAIRSVTVTKPNVAEYCIVDPGSRDNSRQIIDEQRHRFSSIILERDEGPADGLNKGFAAMKNAEICGYINADDRLTPGSLDYACQFFSEEPSTDILLGSIHIIGKDGVRAKRSRYVTKVTPMRYAEKTCAIWQQATFFRRSCFQAVGGFNTSNRTCWDAELVIDMMLAGFRARYTRRPLGEFRIHGESLTGSNNSRHSAAYESDQQRIERKIYEAGIPQRNRLARTISKVGYRLNPYRHVANAILAALDR